MLSFLPLLLFLRCAHLQTKRSRVSSQAWSNEQLPAWRKAALPRLFLPLHLPFSLAFLSLSLCTKKKTMQLVKAVSCNFHTSPVQPSLALLHSPVIRCFTFPLPTKTCGATSVGAKACKLAGGALGRKHILATSLFPFLFLFSAHLPSPVFFVRFISLSPHALARPFFSSVSACVF